MINKNYFLVEHNFDFGNKFESSDKEKNIFYIDNFELQNWEITNCVCEIILQYINIITKNYYEYSK